MKKKFKKRRYIRIATVIPVEFTLIDRSAGSLTPYLQGFTNNISKGGICLAVNDLWRGFADKLEKNARLKLQIEIPFRREAVFTFGRIVWKKEVASPNFKQYRLGIEFEEGGGKDAFSLFKYALFKKTMPFLTAGVLLILLGAIFNSRLREEMLVEENRRLLTEHKKILAESSLLREGIRKKRENLDRLKLEQKELIEKLSFLKNELALLRAKYTASLEEGRGRKEEASALSAKIASLEERIVSLQKEKESFEKRIARNLGAEDVIAGAMKEKEKYAKFVGEKVIGRMYRWIKNRQDLRSGLVLSYEGDKGLADSAFSYDQALAAITFTVFGDFERAKKILDFYLKGTSKERPVYNAYYTEGGVYEYRVHSGVNAWVGLAALNYIKKTGDKKYFKLAENVSGFLLTMLDREGGVVGGPKDSWHSTEHNLDAYAFFRMFYELSREKKYLAISEKIAKWLDLYAYSREKVPVVRGKGDGTIATDTYAWSIAALGPEELLSLGMDPEEIVKFAADNCAVETKFSYRGSEMNVKGFDFAKARNLARGGVISSEWTSQMILAFEIMADYYKDKDAQKYRDYLGRAVFYSSELQKMIINSPSPVGKADPTLPYASQSWVDTGHGWRTPKGNSTGSLAATAYFLLAHKQFNPLKGEFLSISLEDINK